MCMRMYVHAYVCACVCTCMCMYIYISLCVNFQGQFVGIVGKVGSGKTSLLAAINAEMCKLHGEVS